MSPYSFYILKHKIRSHHIVHIKHNETMFQIFEPNFSTQTKDQ